MNRTRGRLVVACLALIGAVIAVAGGSAGNRNGVGSLEALPGPGTVTYGENISYEVKFTNNNLTSGSVFTQTKFVMSPPVGPDGTPATPVATSCGAFDDQDVLTCSFGKLVPGATVTLTVTWKAPGTASQPGCLVDVVAGIHCLKADGTFLIKEGKQTNFNESFPVSADASLIGVSDNDAVNRNKRACGFETTGFTTPDCETGSSNLATHQDLSSANKVSTSFCLPTFSTDKIDQGLAAWIVEEADGGLGHPYLGQSTICVAEFGASSWSARVIRRTRLRYHHADHSHDPRPRLGPAAWGLDHADVPQRRAAPFVPDQRDGRERLRRLDQALAWRRSGRSSGSPRSRTCPWTY